MIIWGLTYSFNTAYSFFFVSEQQNWNFNNSYHIILETGRSGASCFSIVIPFNHYTYSGYFHSHWTPVVTGGHTVGTQTTVRSVEGLGCFVLIILDLIPAILESIQTSFIISQIKDGFFWGAVSLHIILLKQKLSIGFCKLILYEKKWDLNAF